KKCGALPTYVFGSDLRTLALPYLSEVRRGVADKLYKVHHDICSATSECPKNICPDVETASFYCTSVLVSDKYFVDEVRNAPQLITTAWIRKAEQGAREVPHMKAFTCPRNLIDRSKVLALQYRAWLTFKIINDKTKAVFNTITSIERLRKD